MIRKFHPDLRELSQGKDKNTVQIGDEEQMKELWDASNPDVPHEMRSNNKWSYPVENWFGTILREGKKSRLVSVIGHSVRTGKEGQSYAMFGGAKTHSDYGGEGLMRNTAGKALEQIEGMPRIAGYSVERKKSGLAIDRPETHEVIPDDVLGFFRERIEHLPEVNDWGIAKWFALLKINKGRRHTLLPGTKLESSCNICGANDWQDVSHEKNEPNWECRDCGSKLNSQKRKKSSPRGNQSKKQKNREKREARRRKKRGG